MSCSRCGMRTPENGIHLFRNWPGRKEAVLREFPDAEVSFCENPPPASFCEKDVKP